MSAAPVALSAGARPSNQRGWYAQLWVHVLIAMVAGILCGHFWPAFGERMQPFGDAFIKAIRMLIAPIVFCTVVLGIANMNDMARVGRVAFKALIYFEVMTTIALVLGLAAVNLWRPGAGMNVDTQALDATSVASYVAQTQEQGVVAFVTNIIPTTVFGALAEGNVLQVLFLSVLFGATLVGIGEHGRPMLSLLDAASKMLFRAVAIVMWTAPIGAFGAIAFTVGRYGAGALWSLGNLLVCFYMTCLVFVFVILGPVARWCGFSLLSLLVYIREELLIVFATTSSETVLPRMITKLEALGCRKDIVGLVIPTGYSFNLDGTCLYLSTATVFLAQATNTPLGLGQQLGLLAVLLLTSKGAAGVAGAAFVVLAATLSTVGHIPVTSVALILGIHRLMSEGLTPTNLVGNAVATIVVAKWEGALDEATMHRSLAGAAKTAGETALPYESP